MKTVLRNFIGLMCLGAVMLVPSDSRSSPRPNSATTEDRHYWVNFGGGGAWVDGGLGEAEGGLSGGIILSLQNGNSLLSIRWVGNTEFKLDLWGYSGPPETVWDVGALYGRVAKATHGVASIAAGIGLVGMSDNEFSSYRMGIPIEAQLFWTPGSFVGFGIYGFANVNSRKSFAGWLLCLQIRQQ